MAAVRVIISLDSMNLPFTTTTAAAACVGWLIWAEIGPNLRTPDDEAQKLILQNEVRAEE